MGLLWETLFLSLVANAEGHGVATPTLPPLGGEALRPVLARCNNKNTPSDTSLASEQTKGPVTFAEGTAEGYSPNPQNGL